MTGRYPAVSIEYEVVGRFGIGAGGAWLSFASQQRRFRSQILRRLGRAAYRDEFARRGL